MKGSLVFSLNFVQQKFALLDALKKRDKQIHDQWMLIHSKSMKQGLMIDLCRILITKTNNILVLPQKPEKYKILIDQNESNTPKKSLSTSGQQKIFQSLPFESDKFLFSQIQSNNNYMQTTSNILEDDYELCIQSPEYFAKMNDEDDDPGQVEMEINSSHLPEIISIIPQSLFAQESLLYASESFQSVDSSTSTEDQREELTEDQHSFTQNESENTALTSPSKKTKSREDNNNNIHKFFITDVNNCLKARLRLQPIQQMLKKEKTKFEKGSRPSFVFRLIDIRHLFGNAFLAGFLQDFHQSIQKHLILPEKPTPAQLLLRNLVPVYEEAAHIFETGDEIGTVTRIYTIDKAKQQRYKNEGIKKVRNYLAKRSQK